MTQLAVRRPSERDEALTHVVLVHGALDRAANFERVRRALPEHYVVSYDRRGYAGSVDLGAASDMSRQVADLLWVLDGAPAVLIGHSFGGLIALAAAVQAPELVVSLGAYEPPMPWLDGWPSTPLDDPPETAAESFFRRVVGDEAWNRLPESFRHDRRAEGPAVLADFASARAGLPFELSDVLSPVGAAHGSATSARFTQSASAICSAIHGTKLRVIEGAAHGAHMTHPEAFADWVRTIVALAGQDTSLS